MKKQQSTNPFIKNSIMIARWTFLIIILALLVVNVFIHSPIITGKVINFVSPTLENNSYTPNNWLIINISSTVSLNLS